MPKTPQLTPLESTFEDTWEINSSFGVEPPKGSDWIGWALETACSFDDFDNMTAPKIDISSIGLDFDDSEFNITFIHRLTNTQLEALTSSLRKCKALFTVCGVKVNFINSCNMYIAEIGDTYDGFDDIPMLGVDQQARQIYSNL